MTPEAMLLHLIDMMDTRMHMVLREHEGGPATTRARGRRTTQPRRRFYKGGANGDLYSPTLESYD